LSYDIHSTVGTQIADLKAAAGELRQIAAALPEHAQSPASTVSHGFSSYLGEALHSVNDKDRVAAEKMADVDSGRSDDLVGAMLASQEASLSFSMLMQVRNKVMGAVEELIKLPL
jgi:flagellar hook-basal body complex protein FliE